MLADLQHQLIDPGMSRGNGPAITHCHLHPLPQQPPPQRLPAQRCERQD